MAEVLHSPSRFPSSPASPSSSASSSLSCAPRRPGGDALLALGAPASPPSSAAADYGGDSSAAAEEGEEGEGEGEEEECGSKDGDGREGDQLSLLALLFAIFRKSLVACKSDQREICAMEIGWPTNVRHVAHVTFDRFNGFLGLPVELEPEVPTRAPSARYISDFDPSNPSFPPFLMSHGALLFLELRFRIFIVVRFCAGDDCVVCNCCQRPFSDCGVASGL